MAYILLSFSLLLSIAWGAPSSVCSLESVKKVSLPIYPDQADSPEFSYAFQHFPAKSLKSPTIIVIPGGPGIGLIDDWSQEDMKELGVPKGAGLIFLDPRTVDCNKGKKKLFPDAALTTEYLAHDILGVLKALGLKNVILYGHSYGSALATVTASLGEKMGIKPLAVVLTGVIGRWSQGIEGSVYWGLKTQWSMLKERLPVGIIRRFERGDMPLSYTAEKWSSIIEGGLYQGRIMRSGKLVHPLYEALLLLSKNNSRANKMAIKLLKDLAADDNKRAEEDPKWSKRLFKVIDCAELTDTEPTAAFENGEIVTYGDDCIDSPTLIRPFDSKDYLTSSPVFYFAGTAEAVTFYDQARIHFESYVMSNRFFVSVKEGGHNQIGSYYEDCVEALWHSMARQGKGFEKALMSCKASKLMCRRGACKSDRIFEYLPSKL